MFPIMMQPVAAVEVERPTHTLACWVLPDLQEARWQEHAKFLGDEDDMLEHVRSKKVILTEDSTDMDSEIMDDFKHQVQTSITVQTELVVEKVVDPEKKRLQEERRLLKKTTNRAKRNTAMCTLATASATGWKPRECVAAGCTCVHIQCTKRHCNFAHCERALAEGKAVEKDLVKTVDCKFGDDCCDKANCRFLHPGEARRDVKID